MTRDDSALTTPGDAGRSAQGVLILRHPIHMDDTAPSHRSENIALLSRMKIVNPCAAIDGEGVAKCANGLKEGVAVWICETS